MLCVVEKARCSLLFLANAEIRRIGHHELAVRDRVAEADFLGMEIQTV